MILSLFRHIDGAAFYLNENEVGAGIKAAMAETDVKRYNISPFVAFPC